MESTGIGEWLKRHLLPDCGWQSDPGVFSLSLRFFTESGSELFPFYFLLVFLSCPSVSLLLRVPDFVLSSSWRVWGKEGGVRCSLM